jgi:hypothetical protein
MEVLGIQEIFGFTADWKYKNVLVVFNGAYILLQLVSIL